MTGTASPSPTAASGRARAPLPRKVRQILQGFHGIASGSLERELTTMLNEFELQAFQNAEQARSNSIQVRWLEALRTVRRTRPDLIPRFLGELEAQLSNIRNPQQQEEAETAISAGPLALIDSAEMDESMALAAIGSRIEMRHSLPIYLLGQRFGVLAGRPALDAESLPMGPQTLCRLLSSAAGQLGISAEHRVLLYRRFERQMLLEYGPLLEVLNSYLIKNGVLPGLQYVSFRSPNANNRRPATTDSPDDRRSDGEQSSSPASTGANPATAGRADHRVFDADVLQPQPNSSNIFMQNGQGAPLPWLLPGETTHAPTAGAAMGGMPMPIFDEIRDLLAFQRGTHGGPSGSASASAPSGPVHQPVQQEVQRALSLLQPSTATSVNMGGRIVPRTVAHLKQDLLAQLKRAAPLGETPVLAEEDNDTFDLIGMLFDELVKDVRPTSQAASLLTKLQVPLLRVALSDKRFFDDSQHPARQMLNAVAETGAYWLGDDDADGALVGKMQAIVDRTLLDFDGDMELFETLLKDLSSHLQTIARKAEVAERRHVEAARGKERLSQARERAADEVRKITEGSELPVFTRTLLTQAWTDVMALTSLRHGETSDAWKQHLETAKKLVNLAKPGSPAAGADAMPLQKEVADSLRQVGYHEAESEAIAKRLVVPSTEASADDASSRTELLMRMKSASRLGSAERPAKPKLEQLTPEVLERVAQIKTLAFGAWFEFTTNAQGDRVRRRLSWFSPMSGTAMFVNHRGQKVGETSIEHLAIQMVNGQATLVEDEVKGSLIDRAWKSVVHTLSGFGTPNSDKGTTA